MSAKEKRVTDKVLAVSNDFVPWPLAEQAVEQYAVTQHEAFVSVFSFLVSEILDSTRNVRKYEDFIETFTPVLLGCLHGAGIYHAPNYRLLATLNEIMEHNHYADFLQQKEQLAPLLAYSLLIGKFTTVLPMKLKSLF